jgi:type II secretory pathway pseudopilin PulG
MKRKLLTFVIVVVIAAVVVAGVWLLRSRRAAEEKPSTETSKSTAVTSEQVQTLVGRWRRPDGGYIIDIRGLDPAGNLEVAYYNPRPINVSQAQVVQSPKGLHVFIELRDKGYPGATYRLDYDSNNDSMTGVYFQPSVNQSFDVVFVREQ